MKRQDVRDARNAREPEPERALDGLVSDLLAAAVEVHRVLGPGFLESVYERALCVELGLKGLPFTRQLAVTLEYKGHKVGQAFVDLLVGDSVIVELKAIDSLAPIHWSQVRSYLKATGCVFDLLINFNVPVLLRGVRRIIQTV